MPKIKVYVDVGLCGCDKHEIIDFDDAKWKAMSEEEQEDELEELLDWFMGNNVDCGAYVMDDGESEDA